MAPLNLSPVEVEDDMLLPKIDRSEVVDRIAILRIQEESTYRVKDYITESAAQRKRSSKPIDSDCRVKMCEWCYQVVDFCKFRRETVAIGMSYLDRYLCTPKGRSALCNRKEYQLAAMTALYVAIKLHEPLEMETSLLADLSRGCYTEMEFVGMEQIILQAIKWRVNGPTVLAFVAHFLALLPSAIHLSVAESIMEYARFQTELAVAEQSLVTLKPSEVALAAVLNGVEGLDTALFPLKSQAKFLRYIERYSELSGTNWKSNVEKIQAKLSMLMADTLSSEWDDIEEQLLQYAETHGVDEGGDGTSGGRKRSSSGLKNHSPVSVTANA
mmetsp:Transcript_12381/g.25686  ORF Transcript_12381/g.25686 Transcript_12381/m.25686 type:complete len:328 (-) Transcript_12381:105-1088(-)|eukprot:CAMPEP_0172454218 /NCGR_PEP_ID=MMETSP1065-20121228/11276_1 /TAXON_ID=265537 /ORGANISM="Amphiprora paludosa, Strain CCMP125" /LENGTH=327 /DNA_ID=CAMNT_0013206511 /DNA_START=79 /DNA_END=1062 /DNA_ORIENTATION=+